LFINVYVIKFLKETTMKHGWKADPKVLARPRDEARENLSGRLIVDDKSLTWRDVLREVDQGTPFGRKYHNALLESLKAAR
jgi:hypothetical protein